MSVSVISIGKNANQVGAVSGNKRTVTGNISLLISDRMKSLFPRKTWAYVEKLLCVTERVAKHRLAGSRAFTADELAALLRTEHGFNFLVDVMADAKPPWWRLCRPLMDAADALRLQAEAREKISKALEGALNDDVELTATIERGQAAMALQDEEFYSAHLAPLSRSNREKSTAFGFHCRAVATAKSKS